MRHTNVREIVLATVLTATIVSPTLMTSARAQTTTAGFPDLVAGLKATPGCLGVELARTMSGKQVIFAWFENKKAVLNWYYSDMHRSVVKQFVPNATERTPMADVPDDGSPIMAIASLTFAQKSDSGIAAPPFSQIAIELYRPLPGGLAVGGRFAPAMLKVPGMRETPSSTAVEPQE